MAISKKQRPAATAEAPERRNFLRQIFAFVAGGAVAAATPASALTAQPLLGQLALVPYTFAPQGWAFCHGQILQIAQYNALFALIGTTYGGNGQTTFALPDLRGRVPLGSGQGPGLAPYALGQKGGIESVTLDSNQMPNHTHAAAANSANGTSDTPVNGIPAKNASGVPEYSATSDQSMSSSAIGLTGGGLPHENRPPYQCLNYIIALQGQFPSQN